MTYFDRRFWCWFVAFGALLSHSLPGAAYAADYCLREPVAIPNLPGAPEWEDFNGDSDYRPELHDPRWAGAQLNWLLHSESTTTTSDAVGFKLLQDGDVLYVAVHVKADTTPDLADAVAIAFTKGDSGAAAYALQIKLTDSGDTIASPAHGPADSPLPTRLVASQIKVWKTDDATEPTDPTDRVVWSTQSMPTWLKGARWDRSTVQSPRWAVTLRIDLAALGWSATSRKLFVGAQVANSGTVMLRGNTTPVTTANGAGGASIIPPSSTSWATYTTSLTDVACTTGIELKPKHIGVLPGTPGVDSDDALGSTLCRTSDCGPLANTLRLNIPKLGSSVPQGNVRVRFRLSHWGTSPEYASWPEVYAGKPFTEDLSIMTAGGSNGKWWFTPSGSSRKPIIDFQCTIVSGESYCPNLPAGIKKRQRLMAEVAFRPTSEQSTVSAVALKTVTFETLSALEDTATISVKGLTEQLKDNVTSRDVHVQVFSNLTQHSAEPQCVPGGQMAAAKTLAELDLDFPRATALGVLDKKAARSLGASAKIALEQGSEEEQATASLIGKLARDASLLAPGVHAYEGLAMDEEQLLDAVWPTYKIRAYYATGATMKVEGEELDLVVPMPEFGFHLTHTGPLYGFTTELTSKDANLKQLVGSEKRYLVNIANEGAISVSTKIVAEETPTPAVSTPTPGTGTTPTSVAKEPQDDSNLIARNTGYLWALIAFLLGLVIALVIRRK